MDARAGEIEAAALSGAVSAVTDVGEMLLHGHDRVITPTIVRTGRWEPQLADALRAVVRPGMVAVDVGANVGYFVRVLAALVGPAGRVVAIEPDPANLALLRANVRDVVTPVDVIAAAAWESPKTLRLTLCVENTGDHRIAVRAAEREVIDVEGVVLDEVLEDGVDVVVLDTQGTEHLVLRGARAVLARHRPIVFAEFWPDGLREAGTDPLDVLREYREAGFHLRLMEGTGPSLADDVPAEAILEAALAIDPERFGTLMLRPASARAGERVSGQEPSARR